jgi:hypothetical protein
MCGAPQRPVGFPGPAKARQSLLLSRNLRRCETVPAKSETPKRRACSNDCAASIDRGATTVQQENAVCTLRPGCAVLRSRLKDHTAPSALNLSDKPILSLNYLLFDLSPRGPPTSLIDLITFPRLSMAPRRPSPHRSVQHRRAAATPRRRPPQTGTIQDPPARPSRNRPARRS